MYCKVNYDLHIENKNVIKTRNSACFFYLWNYKDTMKNMDSDKNYIVYLITSEYYPFLTYENVSKYLKWIKSLGLKFEVVRDSFTENRQLDIKVNFGDYRNFFLTLSLLRYLEEDKQNVILNYAFQIKGKFTFLNALYVAHFFEKTIKSKHQYNSNHGLFCYYMHDNFSNLLRPLSTNQLKANIKKSLNIFDTFACNENYILDKDGSKILTSSLTPINVLKIISKRVNTKK